jgi:hypothetical protein
MAATLAACGGTPKIADRLTPLSTKASAGRRSDPGRAGVTTTSTSTSTTTTSTLPAIPGVDPALEATVWQAYLDAIHTVETLSINPDPNAPALFQHLTNRQLEVWQNELQDMVTKGETADYPPHSQHRWRLYGATVKYPNWVDLDVCSLDDAVVSVRATGKVVDDKVLIFRSTETMWLQGTTWRLAGREGKYVEASQCPGL